MKIYNKEIRAGKNEKVLIPIANLPSGTSIDLSVFVFRSKNPGPTMLLLGGVHGDEINGIEIVRKAIAEDYFKNLSCGAVIAIPLLNEFGFIQISREFPGGKDINRSFPGTKGGSLASRVAYTLRKYILPNADFGIDYHTGGNMIYNYPQARYYGGDPESASLAKEFNMPYAIESSLIKKSIRKTAHDKGIPMVVFEGGESSRIDKYSIEEGLRGLRNIMASKGLKSMEHTAVKTQILTNGKWQRAGRSGIMNLFHESGSYVEKGQIVGEIQDPNNSFKHEIKSIMTGVIYGHNNNPVINKGDAILHIAEIKH